MAVNETKIAWTDFNFNPFFGCTKCSAACKYCYAEKIAKRGGLDFNVRRHTKTFAHPGIDRVTKPSRFFVNTMSDTFHNDFPASDIHYLFDVMANYPQHTFQVLTKRAERMASMKLNWTDNIWAGVTVEAPQYKYRIDYLRKVPARIRFLSIEPLLADMGELNLRGIHWLIIGGVSGISKETIAELGLNQKDFEQWVLDIIKQGRKAGCKIFYKQDFGFRPQTEPFLKGRQYLEFPL